ncbi:hypothetical protein ACFL5V_07520 [Fibrobacterota bacterium]
MTEERNNTSKDLEDKTRQGGDETTGPEVEISREVQEQRENEEKKRRQRLLQMSRDVFREGKAEGRESEGPFARMLYSIPLFILFWIFYWFFIRRS